MSIQSENDDFFRQVLLRLLRAHGLSQRELAKRIHRSPTTVTNWLNGKPHPRHEDVDLIANALRLNRGSERDELFIAAGYVDNVRQTKTAISLQEHTSPFLAACLCEWAEVHAEVNRNLPNIGFFCDELHRAINLSNDTLDRIVELWNRLYRREIVVLARVFDDAVSFEQRLYDDFIAAVRGEMGVNKCLNKIVPGDRESFEKLLTSVEWLIEILQLILQRSEFRIKQIANELEQRCASCPLQSSQRKSSMIRL